MMLCPNDTDFPHNNIVCWRQKEPYAKWRWILKDADRFGIYPYRGEVIYMMAGVWACQSRFGVLRPITVCASWSLMRSNENVFPPLRSINDFTSVTSGLSFHRFAENLFSPKRLLAYRAIDFCGRVRDIPPCTRVSHSWFMIFLCVRP